MKNKYRGYVKEAKKLIGTVDSYQFKIAEMAIKACENSQNSVADFARDVGIPERTLQNWTQVYRNVIKKIGRTKVSARDWAAACKVNDLLREEENAGESHKGRLPKRKVIQLFKKVTDPKANQFLAINRAAASAKSIKFTLDNTDLSKVSRESLKALMYRLNESSVFLNEYLLEDKVAS